MNFWLTLILILGNISDWSVSGCIELVTGKSFVATIKSINEKKVIFSIPDEADMTYITALVLGISKITMQSGEVLLWENHSDMLVDSITMAEMSVGSNKRQHPGKEQGIGWDIFLEVACAFLFFLF